MSQQYRDHAGPQPFKVLPNLQGLQVSETQVAEEGVKRMQQALPDCGVGSEWGPQNYRRVVGE